MLCIGEVGWDLHRLLDHLILGSGHQCLAQIGNVHRVDVVLTDLDQNFLAIEDRLLLHQEGDIYHRKVSLGVIPHGDRLEARRLLADHLDLAIDL